MSKPTIICGVMNMDGTPVNYTKEEQECFIKNMSNNGEYNVIFDETNTIPTLMSTVGRLSNLNNK